MRRAVPLMTLAALCAGAWPAIAGAQDRMVSLLTTGPNDRRSLIEPVAFAASTDGTRTFFSTRQALVGEDSDESIDVYAREGGTTRLVSRGDGGFNGNLTYDTSGPVPSRDGARIYFVTAEALSRDDNDATADVYERRGDATVLISSLAGAPRADVAVAFYHLSGDGNRATFSTAQSLLPEDADSAIDVYQRDGATLRLISPGAAGGPDARWAGASVDGSTVFFATTESLSASDADGGGDDVYARVGTELRHISVADSGAASAGAITLVGASEDGTRAVLFGAEPLAAGDADAANDVFLRAGGTTTRLSAGPSGGNAAVNASYVGASADVGIVYFSTAEVLTPQDADATEDLYRWSAGSVSIASVGAAGGNGAFPLAFPARAVSTDGRALFSTEERLVAEDGDAVRDLYSVADGVVRLVSQGEIGSTQPIATDAGRWARGGQRAYFRTAEPYTREDVDSQVDVYQRSGERTTLTSPGVAAFDANLVGFSEDGLRHFISTREQLTVDDTDDALDYYEVRTLQAGSATDPAPELGELRLSRRRFPALRRRAHAAQRRRRGTTIAFTVSEPSRILFQASKLGRGRRVGGRCRKPTRANRRGRRCTRQSAVKRRLAVPARGGRNLVRFYGHMGGRRRLRRGRYILYARAYDAANQRSGLRSARFTITRR